ncbi:hypothetical protein ATANTOWER_015010 [Ataeniobius toweri]|uniref:Uncharacterized protein n=1 Tax=Ataeniobius toweri TaxID=208326 RepID=A0ABU7CB15_9TELE|nr:hypothetical protein [Ataeniobius toweri]
MHFSINHCNVLATLVIPCGIELNSQTPMGRKRQFWTNELVMSLNDDEKLILQDDQTLRAAGVGYRV